ncbi:EsaB/YukD family protein [Micromonospora musae]|uniref:EsaB/YukD family protein n=1 Tax=Micromonospora musae TaxID=1894970 RepID=UPI0033C2120E
MTEARCRVTVVGEQSRVDVAIPAHAPIAEYNEMLARLCGQTGDEALPPVWSLAPIGAAAFPLSSSLAGEEIEDGAVLYLRDILSDEDKEPVVRSVWEVVASQAEESRGDRWDVRVASRLAVVIGAFWMVIALAYLGVTGQHIHAVGITSAVVGLCLAGLARLLRRHHRVLPGVWRVALGLGVVPCAVLTAVLAPGPISTDVTHLLYGEFGLWFGLIVALVCVPGVLLGALTFLATCAVVPTTLLVGLHASTTDVAATVVVFGTLLLAVAPRAAGQLVAASWLSISSPTAEPNADPERLSGHVRLAHRTLVLIVGLTAMAVGVALLALTRNFEPFAFAVAVVATIVLFARSATFDLISEALAPILAALAGVFGLTTMLANYGATAVYLMPALLLVGAAGIGFGLPFLLWGSQRRRSDERAASLRGGPLLTVAQVVLPALLLGVYGLYTALWSLGR